MNGLHAVSLLSSRADIRSGTLRGSPRGLSTSVFAFSVYTGFEIIEFGFSLTHFYCPCVLDRVSLCSYGWLGTHYVEQVSLEALKQLVCAGLKVVPPYLASHC